MTIYPYHIDIMKNSLTFYFKVNRDRQRALRKFLDKKNSDTLAILGSGSSVLELGPADFEKLSEIDTVGLNHWCYHSFVPDYYYFEGFGSGQEHALWFDNIYSKEYESTFFIGNTHSIFNNYGNLYRFQNVIPRKVRDNITYITSYPLIVENSQQLNSKHKELFTKIESFGGNFYSVKGSVSVLLQVGYLLGYDNILLVGVDLNDKGYFWKNWDIKTHRQKNEGDGSGRHKTASNSDYIGIQDYVFFIDSKVLKSEGINLRLATEKSLLYPEIDTDPRFVD